MPIYLKSHMPDYIFGKTSNITPEFLKNLGIKHLLLDVDNTLTTHGNPEPAQGIEEWIKTMQENGIKLIITSNNYRRRVEPFAKKIGLDFISFSAKPLPIGFIRAMKRLGGTTKNTVVVGDQIFTDIIGAHILGMKAIMTLAILEEDGIGFKIKRKFEKKYIDLYKKQKGDIL